MDDYTEDLLARAGRVRTSPVDPGEIWAAGRRRQRTRNVVQAAMATLVVAALAVPVVVTAYRDLATPGVDVADTPPSGGSAPAVGCPSPGAGPVVDRAQGVTAVAAAIAAGGGELPDDAPDRFRDDDGTAAEAAINQLAARGVLEGTSRSPERFAPEAPLTRGQLASLLVRSYEVMTGSRVDAPDDPFIDDDASPHGTDAAKATAAGLLGPTAATTFAVKDHVDEQQLDAATERLTARLAGRLVTPCPHMDQQP